MSFKHRYILLKIKLSRLVRGTYRGIQKKLDKSNKGTPSSMVKGIVLPESRGDNEKKYKSTFVVFISGVAIGISQMATVAAKYSKKVCGKTILVVGTITGGIIAGVWYKYMDAAYEGVSEDDISLMFDLANNTTYGRIDAGRDDSDGAKAIDLIHAMVTGKVVNKDEDDRPMFDYDDKCDDDEDKDKDKDKYDEDDEDDENLFEQKVSFTSSSSDSSDEKSPSKSYSPPSFGGSGIGKSLKKKKINMNDARTRKSYLPEIDRQEAEDSENDEDDAPAPEWMDLSH